MAMYNGEPYLRAAISSVLSQDYEDFELIVVDDGSSDDSAAIVHAVGDPRIVYHRNARNLGQTPSLNVGLRMARGDYIARIDTDDEYLPGKLGMQLAFLDANPDVAVCGTWAEIIDEHGSRTGTFRGPTSDRDVRFRLVWTSPVCHVSVLMRRDIVLAAGGYNEAYRYAADYKLWSTLVSRGHRIVSIPRELMRYRIFANSFSGASVLGDAGWESARIIAANAREFCNLQVPDDDARAIHLRAHPQWGCEQDRLLASRHLADIARAVYGRVPVTARAELFAATAWSISQAPTSGAAAQPRTFGERLTVLMGRALRRIRPRALSSLKSAIGRLVRPAPH